MDATLSNPAEPKTSGLAITSLVLGLLSLLTLFITGIPAIICGHIALAKIKKAGGLLKGSGLALTGLIMGYVFSFAGIIVAILAALAVPTAVKALEKAEQVKYLNHTKSLVSSLQLYAADHNNNYPPSLDELVTSGEIDSASLERFLEVKVEDGTMQKMKYVSGLNQTSPSNLIILFSPVLKSDKVIVARLDSSVQVVKTATATTELKAQGITFP